MTLFPEFCDSLKSFSLVGKALSKGAVDVQSVQIRSFSENKHKTVDDQPFGGGPGMVLRFDVLERAWSQVKQSFPENSKTKTLLLSPQGRVWNREYAHELLNSGVENLILVSGHYEGVDQRFIDHCVDEEVSIGDFVLTGGELPAMVLTETLVRLMPQTVGNQDSVTQDSFEDGKLKYPQYTRPQEHLGRSVPEVLVSGDHQKIESWRKEKAVETTLRKRPDLMDKSEGKNLPPIYVVLLHYPMKNRKGETVATAVTNLDLHDISRTCRTFGIKRFYVVTPIPEQNHVVSRILSHWDAERNRVYHPDRASALRRARLAVDFAQVRREITEECGREPEVVMPDASLLPNAVSYSEYRRKLREPNRTRPSVIVFGTGWGIAPDFLPEVDWILAPIYGQKQDPEGEYNHLSVRAAVSIIMDRLCSE